jgi:CRP/FNR family transcriptional regulator, nitrogen oxide reductase regulator
MAGADISRAFAGAVVSKRDRALTIPGQETPLFSLPPVPDVSLNGRLACVKEAPLFYSLALADCTAIASIARERCFSSQQMIFREGDPVRCVFVLASGRVKITRLSRTGAQVLLRVAGTGEVVGGLGLSPESLHLLTAQTLESCQVLTWDARVFEALFDRLPALARNSLRILADWQGILEQRFLELATEPVAQRLARMLVRLAEQSECSIQEPVCIDLTRMELAQMVGTTMFTVSRLLCDWETQGILETRRRAIVVRSPRRMIEFAEAVRTKRSEGRRLTLTTRTTQLEAAEK